LIGVIFKIGAAGAAHSLPNTVRLVHFLLGRVVELRPDFALEAVVAVERGVVANRELRLRTASIRTLGALSRGTGAEGHVLTVLCDHLAQLQASEGKEEHKGKKKRFSLFRRSSGPDDDTPVAVALVRSIRATGCAASGPINVLLAAVRVQDGVSVRHALFLLLQLVSLKRDGVVENRGGVVEAVLEMLASESHMGSIASDALASLYLSRLCAIVASHAAVGEGGGGGQESGGSKRLALLAASRRQDSLHKGDDVVFLHALRTCPQAHGLLPGDSQESAQRTTERLWLRTKRWTTPAIQFPPRRVGYQMESAHTKWPVMQ